MKKEKFLDQYDEFGERRSCIYMAQDGDIYTQEYAVRVWIEETPYIRIHRRIFKESKIWDDFFQTIGLDRTIVKTWIRWYDRNGMVCAIEKAIYHGKDIIGFHLLTKTGKEIEGCSYLGNGIWKSSKGYLISSRKIQAYHLKRIRQAGYCC